MGVFDVSEPPSVIGDRVKDVEAETLRRHEASVDHLRGVPQTTIDGRMSWVRRAVLQRDSPEPEANAREVMGFTVVSCQAFSPDLTRTIQCGGTYRRFSGEDRPPLRHCIILPVDDGVEWGVLLVSVDDRPGTGEEYAFHLRVSGSFEHVIGSDNVGAEGGFPGGVADERGEMDDGVLTVERGLDGVEVGDVGSVTGHARDSAAVERGELILVFEMGDDCAANDTAESRDEDVLFTHWDSMGILLKEVF